MHSDSPALPLAELEARSTPRKSPPKAAPVDAADSAVRVYFEGESTRVAEQYHDVIREQAERFRAGPGGTLIVSGHANPAEEPEAAVQLSMHRTHAVATLLESFGVQSHRIVRVSHGANAPIVDFADESVRWVNRCVEIRHGGLAPRQPVWSQRTRKTRR